MYYHIFKVIETRMAYIPAVKTTDWYNAQYETTIPVTPCVLVEFPNSGTADHASKDVTRVPINIRLHVVSKIIANPAGRIDANLIYQNEMSCYYIIKALANLHIDAFKPLKFTGQSVCQSEAGFIISFVNFTTAQLVVDLIPTIFEIAEEQPVEEPPVENPPVEDPPI